MDNKKTITIIILGLVAMAGILLFLFLPSKSHLAILTFMCMTPMIIFIMRSMSGWSY